MTRVHLGLFTFSRSSILKCSKNDAAAWWPSAKTVRDRRSEDPGRAVRSLQEGAEAEKPFGFRYLSYYCSTVQDDENIDEEPVVMDGSMLLRITRPLKVVVGTIPYSKRSIYIY